MEIEFNHYVRPNGKVRKEIVAIYSSKHEKMYKELIDFGAIFDMEILRNGLVSITCEVEVLYQNYKEREILAFELFPKTVTEDEFIDNVELLIEKAHHHLSVYKPFKG